MDALGAARAGDEIAHGFGLAAMVGGAVLGALAGAAVVAVSAATGGLAAVIIAGSVAGGGLSAAQLLKGLNTAFNLPEPSSGMLIGGSPNVFVNSRNAMRAGEDVAAACSGFPMNHPPLPAPVIIAEGSASVFINGKPAARLSGKLVCGAHIKSASPDVSWGGPIVSTNFVFDLEGWGQSILEVVAGLAMLATPFVCGISVGLALATKGFLIATGSGALAGILVGACSLVMPYVMSSLAASADAKWGPGRGDILLGSIGLLSIMLGLKWAKQRNKSSGLAVEERPSAGKSLVGEPVDVVTGEVVLQQTDFALPGSLPLVFQRTHISGYAHGTLLGPNWASSWGQWLAIDAREIVFHADDGASYRLENPPSGQRVTHRIHTTLTLENTGEAYVVQWRHGPRLHFAPHALGAARLVAITERNGARIAFDYDGFGRLTDVRHSGGTCLVMEHGPAGVARIALAEADGRLSDLIRYTYDDLGRLAGIVNSSGLPLKFSYDAAGRLTGWEDRRGHCFAYQYDAAGRCVRTASATGHYNGRFSYDEASRTTTYINALGHSSTYTHNEQFQLIRKEDARGASTHTTYDALARRIAETSPKGATTRWAYDARGNLISIADPVGRQIRIAYNEQDLPVSLTDPAGTVWQRSYDERGNLTAVGTAEAIWRYEHDANGNVVRAHDPSGHFAEFAYDSRGLLIRATDRQGHPTCFERDARGQIQTRIDAQGQRTAYRYTPEGLLAAIVLADGRIEHAHYDAEGNLVQRIDPQGLVTRFEYGPFDKLIASAAPNGAVTRYAYDAELQLVAVTNPLGEGWHYRYNAAGQLVEEQDFSGRKRHFELDIDGQLLAHTDALGQTTRYRRDLLGRLIEKIAPEGNSRFAYDVLGRLIEADSPGAELRFEFDTRGRLVRETQNGQSITSIYDALGRRTRRQTEGGHDSTWQFDANGLPVALALPDAHLFDFVHDSLGRETRRTLPGGLKQDNSYDALGRLTSQRTLGPAGGHPIQGRQLHYGAHGLPERIDDATWGRTDYRFDAVGQVTEAVHPDGHERYAYDLAGNLLQAIQFNARHAVAEAATQGARSYGAGRLTQAGRVRYEYDAEGRVVTRTEGRRWGAQRRWHYAWTSDNRLHRLTTPDGEIWHYTYDALGRRLSKQLLKNGQPWRETRYLWDGHTLAEETRLRYTLQPDGSYDSHIERRTQWDYEPGSFRPLAKTDLVPTKDGSRRLTYAILTDPVGTPRELVTPEGEIAWQARTDLWGAVQEIKREKTDCPLRFQGQYHDDESDLHYNHQRYYDPGTGRYLTPDPLGLAGGDSAYAYVANPLTAVDPLGLMGCGAGEVVANSAKTSLGVLDDAVFAQVRSKPTKEFSFDGQAIYSELAGRPIKTVGDLTQALREGVVTPGQIPIDYVLIDGRKVIANTRSSTALLDAGIPKSQWLGRDRTGVTAYGDVLHDDLVRNQLKGNYGGSVDKARR